MKNLFVTFNAKTNKKQERQNIFLCCERKEEIIDINENCPLINKPDNSLNNTLNTSSSSTTNSSIDSGKITYNFFIPEQFSVNPNFSVNSNINKNNPNYSNCNKFLGKKTKIHFDVIKKEETKGINCNNNNCNIFNISNSQSTDSSVINKDIEKNESFELEQERTEKSDINDYIDNTDIIIKKLKNKENNGYLNEGRWSFQEHIKFIEAIAEYGKNWKDVQKYVGSRSSAQARSHAQKFFLKLKAIKNSKSDFDFSSNNIKNLSDIIETIKRKEEYSKKGKEYIINTLINLSKSISCENLDLYKDVNKNSKNNSSKEKENGNEDEKNEEFEYNNNKELKADVFNDLNNINYKTENKIESKEYNNDKNRFNENATESNHNNNNIINENNKNINENNTFINEVKEDIINDKKNNKDDINKINKEKEKLLNNNMQNINNINNTKIEEKYNNYENHDNYLMLEEKGNNYIIDDGIIYVTDNLDILDMNNISFKIKEYYYLKSYELPYLLYNKYFYS